MSIAATAGNEGLQKQLDECIRQLRALQRQSNKHDPAHKRLAFIGFSAVGGPVRVTAIKSFLAENAPDYTPTIGHFTSYDDSTGTRRISKVSYAEFPDPDSAKSVLASIKSKFPQCSDTNKGVKLEGIGAQITVRHAKSQQNTDRDTALREAEKLVRGSAAASGKDVVRKAGSERAVTVNGEVAFKQGKKGLDGVFYSPFDSLQLP